VRGSLCVRRATLWGEVLISKREKVTAAGEKDDDGISGGNQAYISHASQAAHTLCSKRALCNQKVARRHSARPQRWKKRAHQDHGFFFIFHLSRRYRSRQLCCLPHIYTRTSALLFVPCANILWLLQRKGKIGAGGLAFVLGRAKNILSRARQLSVTLLECERAGPICRKMQSPRVSMLAHT
jgi:hypothetical protein